MNKSFRELIRKEQWEHIESILAGTTQKEIWYYVVITSEYGGFIETKHRPAEIVVCNGKVTAIGYEDRNGYWQDYPFRNLKELSLETAKFYLETMLRMEGRV